MKRDTKRVRYFRTFSCHLCQSANRVCNSTVYANRIVFFFQGVLLLIAVCVRVSDATVATFDVVVVTAKK